MVLINVELTKRLFVYKAALYIKVSSKITIFHILSCDTYEYNGYPTAPSIRVHLKPIRLAIGPPNRHKIPTNKQVSAKPD